MKIYNTLTQKKTEFKPIQANHISLYVCGMTVYDHCHIGHARSMIVFDMLTRYFRNRRYHVNYVRNITDIDDKIIQRSQENKEPWHILAERFIQSMQADEYALDILPPNHTPRATQYIPDILKLIQKLIDQKYAYIAHNKDVYFDVRKIKQYGKLSHRNIDQLQSDMRLLNSQLKRDPLDFVLWKQSKPDEPAWDSPWGPGRPGWHIECSAMSTTLLGQPFDLHGGGMDLKFPHHENEIAQSEAAYSCGFANIWMHVGLLQINGEKMSKSLGNHYTIQEVLKTYDPELIRYFMISAHYRSPLNYSRTHLSSLRNSLDRLYLAIRGLPKTDKYQGSEFEQLFYDAMEDDFNTPLALSVLFKLSHHIQSLRENNCIEKASAHANTLKKLSSIFCMLQRDPEDYFQSTKKTNDIDANLIEQLINKRHCARKERDWKKADRIRQQLIDSGIAIEDTAAGTVWRRQ